MQRLVRAARVLPVLLILGVGACQTFLDVNQNPNAPENAAVDVRLPALITEFIHSTYYGENALWGAEWTQQFSYNRDTRSYSQVQRYELSETDMRIPGRGFDFVWRRRYLSGQHVNGTDSTGAIYSAVGTGWDFSTCAESGE